MELPLWHPRKTSKWRRHEGVLIKCPFLITTCSCWQKRALTFLLVSAACPNYPFSNTRRTASCSAEHPPVTTSRHFKSTCTNLTRDRENKCVQASVNALLRFHPRHNGPASAPVLHITKRCKCIRKHLACQSPSLSRRPSTILAVVMLAGCSYVARGQLTLTSFLLRDMGGRSV